MTTALHDLMSRTPGLPCRLDATPFFSDYPTDRRRAVRLCGPCPLQLACRSYALETGQEWGVWGGHDFTAVETYCGTERGHQIHVRNREQPCEWCAEAHAELIEGRRRERLKAEHAKGGTVRGYEIHRVLGEAACDACRAASGRKSAERRAQQQRGPVRLTAVVAAEGARDPVRGAPAGAQPLALAG